MATAATWHDGLIEAFPIPLDRVIEPIVKKKLFNPHITELGPFRFLDLPGEIRTRIYALVLQSKTELQLPRPPPRTSILCVSKEVGREAAYTLHTTNKFRVFALQEFTRNPVVSELKPHYRAMISNLELSLGESWTNPPKHWNIKDKALKKALLDLGNVQRLKIFITLDPFNAVFDKWPKLIVAREKFVEWCAATIVDLIRALPKIHQVDIDGYPSVDMKGVLVSRIKQEILAEGRMVVLNEWDPGVLALTGLVDRLGLQL